MGKKNFFRSATLLLALLITGALCSGCPQKTAPAQKAVEKPVAVKTAPVVAGAITPALTITGTVTGEKEVELNARTQGTVTAFNVRAGDRVRAGQVLAVLESENQRLTVAKAQEQVNNARINLEKARLAFARADALYQEEAIAQAEWENARFMLESAETAYNAARADLQLAEKTVRDATITAPCSGSVVETFVAAGQTVFPGTKLLTLVDDTRLKVKATIAAPQLRLVFPEQRGTFTTPACPGKAFPCTVKTVGSVANPANRAFTIELLLPATARQSLKPGIFGYVRLQTAPIKGTVIPRAAIITQDETGTATIFTVKKGKARVQKIKTGQSDARNILVLEGLKPGERVVVFGQNLLQDGTPVTEGE
ncbi:RND family efflux transporter MFP subunit [Thermodesulfitimonas autotrophica]|uniref:RND family efflux transporter MFP subunit n=1 Tax=Thermodesulfitimonas autotrophica TaxID=1894989 RepID=A0A3N5AD01_9THEO|nr:efflux RND transporter periplasmic adaptor subunit [Thermodesulfitimonas autotrophica]RPF42423.1 RND family efflux transporter MFP subunit [Thermodesulfitimonas autotrophica]